MDADDAAVRHARYVILQLAEVAVLRTMVAAIYQPVEKVPWITGAGLHDDGLAL